METTKSFIKLIYCSQDTNPIVTFKYGIERIMGKKKCREAVVTKIVKKKQLKNN